VAVEYCAAVMSHPQAGYVAAVRRHPNSERPVFRLRTSDRGHLHRKSPAGGNPLMEDCGIQIWSR